MGSDFANKIAKICHHHYCNLPKKGKPAPKKEWTLLSAIVMALKEELTVVSMATGTKCLGHKAMSPRGDVVNDSHAEVLARRCFLRYMYHQIQKFEKTGNSEIIIDKENNLFKINPDVKFHLYSSHVPCGDASIIPKQRKKRKIKNENDDTVKCKRMVETDSFQFNSLSPNQNILENYSNYKDGSYDKNVNSTCDASENLSINSNDESVICKKKTINKHSGEDHFEDVDDIYRTGAKCVSEEDKRLPGVDYHIVGAVRTKPGRGDLTLSVSCSDKIARWIACGLQGALLSLMLAEPVYLESVVIGGGGPYSSEVMNRALISRIFPFAQPNGGPEILRSICVFTSSRYSANSTSRPCPSAILWSKVPYMDLEVCVEGRKQGTTKKSRNNGGLMVCKLELLKMFLSLTGKSYSGMNYCDIKASAMQYKDLCAQIKTKLGAWTVKPHNLEEFQIT